MLALQYVFLPCVFRCLQAYIVCVPMPECISLEIVLWNGLAPVRVMP